MFRVSLSLAAGFSLLLCAQSAPAEARKLGGISRAVTGVSIRPTVRGARGDSSTAAAAAASQTVAVDADARAAHSKAKLEEEAATSGALSDTATPGETSGGKMVCLAGCN